MTLVLSHDRREYLRGEVLVHDLVAEVSRVQGINHAASQADEQDEEVQP